MTARPGKSDVLPFFHKLAITHGTLWPVFHCNRMQEHVQRFRTRAQSPRYSLVLPIYNEEEVLP
ncbi:hypothetical protein, partial [Mesorhizobium sp. M1E.F.Ca.ET.063.01.1.1]|uniref:hypothetical protein n=1 Tax=Mesorhizobium sp. M1E.F.Ca.ET.063.01.1.1 TaxID=2496750 RepID=UPI001AECEEE0